MLQQTGSLKLKKQKSQLIQLASLLSYREY